MSALATLRHGVVVSHPGMGVLLGIALGLAFWSKLDPVGQDCAAVFESETEARNLVARVVEHGVNESSHDFVFTAVEADFRGYATIAEIVRVGLPAWDPDWSPNREAE